MPLTLGKLPIYMRIGDVEEVLLGDVELTDDAVNVTDMSSAMAQTLREAAERLDARRIITDAVETDPEKIRRFKDQFPTARTYIVPDAD